MVRLCRMSTAGLPRGKAETPPPPGFLFWFGFWCSFHSVFFVFFLFCFFFRSFCRCSYSYPPPCACSYIAVPVDCGVLLSEPRAKVLLLGEVSTCTDARTLPSCPASEELLGCYRFLRAGLKQTARCGRQTHGPETPRAGSGRVGLDCVRSTTLACARTTVGAEHRARQRRGAYT